MHQGLAARAYTLLITVAFFAMMTMPRILWAQDAATEEDVYQLDTQTETDLNSQELPPLGESVAPEPPPQSDVVEEGADAVPDAVVEETPAEPAAEDVVSEVPVEEPTAQAAPEPEAIPTMPTEQTLTYPADVEVEKSVYAESAERCNCEYTYLKPYGERRGNWGFTFAVAHSQYSPISYKPDFVANQTFQDFYGTAETPLTDGTLGLKWNASFGALIFEAGAGYYQNQGNFGSSLTVIPVRLGLNLTLDRLFSQPYIAPYAAVGTFSGFYEENLASQKVAGNTGLGFYWAAGSLFSLNWMDEEAATRAYDEQGLENAYVFAEVRSFIATDTVPNLGTSPQLGAGVKLEY